MISAVGIAVVDHIMFVDGFSDREGSYHCEHYIAGGGGMAATAMCAAAMLGSEAKFFSRVGVDPDGDFIIRELEKYGVDTSGIVRVPGRPSTAAFVLVDRTTGDKQFWSQWTKPAFADFIELDTSHLEGSEVLLVDGHWMEGAIAAARWASEHGIPVVADFKRRYEHMEELFPCIDYLIIPEFFACELAGGDIEDVLRGLDNLQSGIPIVTMGDRGGVWLDNGTCRKYESFPVECVDSTGAGDAFHGAFCHFLARGASIDRTIELSAAVGALNCRCAGGRASLPTSAELAAFLDRHGKDSTLP